ncbi:hypothetical protein C1708_19355 [Streptomyces sp. DH-12]|nr:hypothetical protein C1708_19355 [Streptomyces sp. DH-12]
MSYRSTPGTGANSPRAGARRAGRGGVRADPRAPAGASVGDERVEGGQPPAVAPLFVRCGTREPGAADAEPGAVDAWLPASRWPAVRIVSAAGRAAGRPSARVRRSARAVRVRRRAEGGLTGRPASGSRSGRPEAFLRLDVS